MICISTTSHAHYIYHHSNKLNVVLILLHILVTLDIPIYLDPNLVGNNCDHVHQSEQFHTATRLVVASDSTVEVVHIWGYFFQS